MREVSEETGRLKAIGHSSLLGKLRKFSVLKRPEVLSLVTKNRLAKY